MGRRGKERERGTVAPLIGDSLSGGEGGEGRKNGKERGLGWVSRDFFFFRFNHWLSHYPHVRYVEVIC